MDKLDYLQLCPETCKLFAGLHVGLFNSLIEHIITIRSRIKYIIKKQQFVLLLYINFLILLYSMTQQQSPNYFTVKAPCVLTVRLYLP